MKKVAKRHFFEFLRVSIRSDAHVVGAGFNIRCCGLLSTPGLSTDCIYESRFSEQARAVIKRSPTYSVSDPRGGSACRKSILYLGEQAVRRGPSKCDHLSRRIVAATLKRFPRACRAALKAAVYFCCTFLGVASTGCYPALCPAELGLSSYGQSRMRSHSLLAL